MKPSPTVFKAISNIIGITLKIKPHLKKGFVLRVYKDQISTPEIEVENCSSKLKRFSIRSIGCGSGVEVGQEDGVVNILNNCNAMYPQLLSVLLHSVQELYFGIFLCSLKYQAQFLNCSSSKLGFYKTWYSKMKVLLKGTLRYVINRKVQIQRNLSVQHI